MDGISICQNKFKYAHQTIALSVSLENLPEQLIIEGSNLVLRDEFHVSLVCIGEIIKKHNISIPDFENKIMNDFCEFTKHKNVNLESYYDNFKFCIKDDKKTVIVLCKISNLYEFFDFINEKYKLNIEYPPTHVTIYTLKSTLGIFLTDLNDIKNFTKPIKNPIGRLL